MLCVKLRLRNATSGVRSVAERALRPSDLLVSYEPGRLVGNISVTRGRLRWYVFLWGFLSLNVIYQDFARIAPEFHRNLAGISHRSTIKKGDNHDSAFPHGDASHLSCDVHTHPPPKQTTKSHKLHNVPTRYVS